MLRHRSKSLPPLFLNQPLRWEAKRTCRSGGQSTLDKLLQDTGIEAATKSRIGARQLADDDQGWRVGAFASGETLYVEGPERQVEEDKPLMTRLRNALGLGEDTPSPVVPPTPVLVELRFLEDWYAAWMIQSAWREHKRRVTEHQTAVQRWGVTLARASPNAKNTRKIQRAKVRLFAGTLT